MRIPFLSMFVTSPLDGLLEHAEKVRECGLAFQQAMECFMAKKCESFEKFRQNVARLENEADAIKRRIRGHLPKGTLLPVDKFQLFRYIREQDHVLDAVKDTLDLISMKVEFGIPEELEKDLALLVDSVIEPIEKLAEMVEEARKYFSTFSEDQRKTVKDIIRSVREKEHDADQIEFTLKKKILNSDLDQITIFHMYKIAETIGQIADHAENTGDMMRAMVAK